MICPLKKTLAFIRACSRNSGSASSRGWTDFLADRILQASSRATLMDFVEALLKGMDADLSAIKDAIAGMSTIDSASGLKVIAWLRKHPKVAASLATLKNDDFDEIVDSLSLDEIDNIGDRAYPFPEYRIGITATLLSPLAHGADGKSGNATLFRRALISCMNGKSLQLPFYAGNAVRGIVRDLLADDFLNRIGLDTRRDKPSVALWFFYMLYSGGALEEGGGQAAKALAFLGNNGAANAEGFRTFRDYFPNLSALGAAAGSRILSGKAGAKFSDWLPVCYEWNNGEAAGPVAELIDWQFLTRHDDYDGLVAKKKRGNTDNEAAETDTKHQGMIALSEVLRPGTVLRGGVDLDKFVGKINHAVIAHGMELLKESGYIGAENRRGFGNVEIEYTGLPDSSLYTEFLSENKEAILEFMQQIGALAGEENDAHSKPDIESTPKKSARKNRKGGAVEAVADDADEPFPK